MSLPHALLTALLERPCSGAELAKRFDRSIGHFWHATHQQIYRELAWLEEAHWIEALPGEEAARGRKRTYRVLPAGREELRRWVAQQSDPQWLRDELMVRLRAEAIVGPTELRSDIERRLQLHAQKLAHYQELERRDFPGPDRDRATALQHFVLSAGIRHESYWMEVLQQALELLAQPEDASAGLSS